MCDFFFSLGDCRRAAPRRRRRPEPAAVAAATKERYHAAAMAVDRGRAIEGPSRVRGGWRAAPLNAMATQRTVAPPPRPTARGTHSKHRPRAPHPPGARGEAREGGGGRRANRARALRVSGGPRGARRDPVLTPHAPRSTNTFPRCPAPPPSTPTTRSTWTISSSPTACPGRSPTSKRGRPSSTVRPPMASSSLSTLPSPTRPLRPRATRRPPSRSRSAPRPPARRSARGATKSATPAPSRSPRARTACTTRSGR